MQKNGIHNEIHGGEVMDETAHNLFYGKPSVTNEGLHSNMTGQMSQTTLKDALDEMIRRGKEDLGKPFVPIPNNPVWITSPTNLKDMESKGYVKNGEFTELGMKTLF
jgi:hypothetical protein